MENWLFTIPMILMENFSSIQPHKDVFVKSQVSTARSFSKDLETRLPS